MLDVAPRASRRAPIGRAALPCLAIGGMTRATTGDLSGRVLRRHRERAVLQRQAVCELLQGGFYHTHKINLTPISSRVTGQQLHGFMRTCTPEV